MSAARAFSTAFRAGVPRAPIAARFARGYAAAAPTGAANKPPVALFGVDGTYASALYTAAAKTNALDNTAKSLEQLSAVFKRDAKLAEILRAPTLSVEDKKQIVQELQKHVGQDKEGIVKNFLDTLAQNNRLGVLEGVVNNFGILMGAHRGEIELVVTSAAPLDNKTLSRLEAAVSKSQYVGQGQKLKVVPKVNPEIKGGLIVEIGDRTIDLSVSSKMAKMNKLLKDTFSLDQLYTSRTIQRRTLIKICYKDPTQTVCPTASWVNLDPTSTARPANADTNLPSPHHGPSLFDGERDLDCCETMLSAGAFVSFTITARGVYQQSTYAPLFPLSSFLRPHDLKQKAQIKYHIRFLTEQYGPLCFSTIDAFTTHRALDSSTKANTQEGETPKEFFGSFNEASESQSDHESTSNSPSADDRSASPHAECSIAVTVTLATSAPLATTASNKYETQVPSNDNFVGVSPSDPFPFLKLPLSVRNRVYEHLLVIPAIICVKQKHSAFHDEKKELLFVARRELLPGIAYGLTQSNVDGSKSRFSRFWSTNLNILRVSKQVFTEARAVMYSKNEFDIVKPSNELTPEPDYSVPLFPLGYQRLVTKLNMRIRTFYDLDWLLSGGYNVIKNYYRGLGTLTLILEMDSATKGFGRQWARKSNEKWTEYITRLRCGLTEDLFKNSKSKRVANIPAWIDLRVLFSGESYVGRSPVPLNTTGVAVTSSMNSEQVKKGELRHALVEAFELFKKGAK
ncbi:ATP synthase F0 subcomplex subunit OSCP atp5 [Didymella heteroderae]|uniref:ATP synthase subunit 5, mitochondrial n=1 Tax=Didymella heteroderae TaxID=1769908 RepID=A0A9P4X2P9_9PLEO|nr:ATP synthase F0 subcomplex subunit OSCP atp5 [Didymella heteroderae]